MVDLGIIAQAAQDYSRVFIWSLVLVGALVLLFVVVHFYRKWMASAESTSGPGFSLSDLRKLHKEGKMTTEEFDKAKALVIGSMKAAAEAPKAEANKGGLDARRGARNKHPNEDQDTSDQES